MTAMLHCLVGDVAAEIRAALPSGRLAANDEGDAVLVVSLTAAGLLDEAGLMALLLRRADEERISTAARARTGRREARVLQGLVSHDYGAVAAAAMALILGRGRRRDRFGQCLISFDDLSESSAEALVHAVAAGLRRDLAAGRGISGADRELAEASEKVLEHRDEERGTDVLTAALVHFLDEAGGLTDELVLARQTKARLPSLPRFWPVVPGFERIRRRMSYCRGTALPNGAIAHGGMSRTLSAGLLAGIGDLLAWPMPARRSTFSIVCPSRTSRRRVHG